MRREPRAFLWDVRDGATAIAEFTTGRTFEDYLGDRMLRSAVERQFEIIGEALAQLTRVEPGLAKRIPDAPQIIAFRNLLIHGYAAIDHTLVWHTIETDLPALRAVADRLLAELGETP